MKSSSVSTAIRHHYEGLRLTAYRDGGGVLTIGWGHTGPDVHAGLTWTAAQADAADLADVASAEAAVSKAIKNKAEQCQFDAMLDMAYNAGEAAFASSTLVKKHNAGDFEGAADEFLRWDHDNGVRVAGLAKRCAARRAIYLGTTPAEAFAIGEQYAAGIK